MLLWAFAYKCVLVELTTQLYYYIICTGTANIQSVCTQALHWLIQLCFVVQDHTLSITSVQEGTSSATHSTPFPGTQCPEKPRTECSPAQYQDRLRGNGAHCRWLRCCTCPAMHALQLTGWSAKYSSISLESFSCTSGWRARRYEV